MTLPADVRALHPLQRIAPRGAAVIILGLGVAVLCGWILDIPTLTRMTPTLASMKANTAMAFILAAASLWMLVTTGRRRPALAAAGAVLVMLIGLATVGQDLLIIDLGIDQLLVHEDAADVRSGHPGRMAPTTATSFALAGLAMLLALRRTRIGASLSQSLAAAVSAVGLLAIIGYLYGVEPLHRVADRLSGMAVHTSVGMLVLGIGILAATIDRGWGSIFVSRTWGGTLSRTLLPTAIGVVVLVGWLCIQGERHALYDPAFSAALFALASSGLIALLVWWTAWRIHRAELLRREVDQRVAEARHELGLSEALKSGIIESSLDGLITIDDRGRIVEFNSAAEKLLGHRRADVLGAPMAELIVPPDLREQHYAGLERYLETGEARVLGRHLEMRALRSDGSEIPVELAIVRIPSSDPPVFAGHLRDISERKRSEARVQTVTAELNHRVKNTLATVSAIARQTIRQAPDLPTFEANFVARLQSIAKAHSLLTKTHWEGADLAEIVEAELNGCIESADHLELAGPPVLLRPKLALAMHMVVHELTTNACKHGALSKPGGRVAVEWVAEGETAAPTIALTWTERCAHRIEPPAGAGFGTALIEQIVDYELHGEVERDYQPDGLRCRIRFAVDRGGPASSPEG